MSKPINVPDDLTLSSEDDLRELETNIVEEFNSLQAQDDVTPEVIEALQKHADNLDRVRAELAVREDRAKRDAELQQQKYQSERERLAARVNGEPDPTENEDEGREAANSEAIAQATAEGVTAALFAAFGDENKNFNINELQNRAKTSLSSARKYAPASVKPRAQQLTVTAGVDIPGLARGADLNNLEALTDAFHRRAKGMPVSRDGQGNEMLVASIRNEFENTIDDRTSPAQVGELFQHLTNRSHHEALVAGGGWCAPSEVRYDFFNIACEDGTIDLPTFGVSRGGVRFPVSPSLADAGLELANITNSTQPWLWTEDDDEATVTGDPNKPCIRVPCPSFDERRLECYGICLTAGNLADDAYPEATQNFLRLLMSAHSHAMNARIISTMESLSTVAPTGGAFQAADTPAFTQILSGAALAATDYRARFGMCEDDVLEVVIPQWVIGIIQADLARRTGDEQFLSVTRAQIISFFADRNLRPQFVNDWQVRGSGQFGDSAAMLTDWPSSVNIMVYAAGTFLLGNGLSLDLGVVRDSVLNAENDHTAAWSEECHLVARVGHESRLYNITFDAVGDHARYGATGAGDGA